ncbi:DoxX family protein [Spirosoma utsteinense]|uniref:Oxidoreductase n=1 Tax=Spirosoma utsteinense TaxID=2585773 RepID=A0ABR6WAJ9_9BACT|nr:DoxX family protein [Spirosoma utsteinense]MBC3786749.1 putative oxidoreductase [Spirosoma utsteinense]MBC3793309.1 putative oxidoreductase [Spirosoma utsteinense]
MLAINRYLTSLDRFRDYAPFLLRLAFAYELFDAAGHTALHPADGIPGYASWLQELGFPFPVFSALLSAYTEFFGALLMALGWKTRWAALLLAINFILAIAVGHVAIADTYKNTFPAINLLAMSFFLLLNGPGKPSIDEGL